MKRCIGGIGGGIDTYTSEKSCYKSVGWIYTIGGLPLRHHPCLSRSFPAAGPDFVRF